jgi:hypothetical protein
VIGGCVWIVLTTAALLLRQQGVPAWDTIWAEDGRLFLPDALREPIGALNQPYTGYLHLAPRIVAAAAAAFPLEHAAWALALIPALVVAALSLYVFQASGAILRSLPARVAVASSMVLLPAAGYETANNATNLRWYLLYAGFWSLVRTRRNGKQAGLDAGVAGMCALSDPFTVVLAPLAWCNLRGGGRNERLVWAVAGGALLVQLSVVFYEFVIAGGPPLRTGEFGWANALGLLGMRVGMTFVLGDRLVQALWPLLGWWSGWIGLTLIIVMAVYAASRKSLANRRLTLYVLALSCALFFVSIALRGTETISPDGNELVAVGLRWTVAPILFLIAGAVMLLDEPDPRVARIVWKTVTVVAGALLILVFASNYLVWSVRSLGPSWSAELERARGRCLSGRTSVTIPIAPIRPEGAWEIRLQCERLGPASGRAGPEWPQ